MLGPLDPVAGNIQLIQPDPYSLEDIRILFAENNVSPPSDAVPSKIQFKEKIEPIEPVQSVPRDRLIFSDATDFLDKSFEWIKSAAAQLGNSLNILPKIALFAIPIIGIGFAVHAENQKDEEGKEEIKSNGFNDNKIINLITEKNDIKWLALIAFTVNAAIFATGLGIFPFACAIIATSYLCLVLKNLAQMHANKILIDQIIAEQVIAPVGAKGIVKKDRTEFVWSTSVE